MRIRKSKAPILAAWLASVPEGTCPGCKRKKPQPRIDGPPLDICRRAPCRKKWMKRYGKDRLPAARAEVVETVFLAHKPGRFMAALTLSCGHTLKVRRMESPAPAKRQCPRCVKLRARASARLNAAAAQRKVARAKARAEAAARRQAKAEAKAKALAEIIAASPRNKSAKK